jgi:hypothetical protein
MEVYAARKLLGPTLDMVGTEVLPGLTERGLHNLGRVLHNAYDKLGTQKDEPGSVPPRVLRAILDEAPYASDEVVAEYMGGVLASSRSGVTRDDRGVAYLALISGLSTYDLRLHYIGYATAQRLLQGRELDLGDMPTVEEQAKLFIPEDSLAASMAFTDDEDPREIMDASVVALAKEELILSTEWGIGGPEAMNHFLPLAGRSGWVFAPSPYGIGLYVWAHGQRSLTTFLKGEFVADPLVPVPQNGWLVREPPTDEPSPEPNDAPQGA